MKNSLKKKVISISMCVVAVSTLMIPSVFAAYKDNNIGFSFRIQGSVDNAQAPKSEFRNTSDNSNSWKVQMSKSGEGQHTITNFWIVNKNGRSASSEYSIKQEDSARYKRANDNGDHINVYLTAENNNFMSSKTYTVTGYWDEETGVYLKKNSKQKQSNIKYYYNLNRPSEEKSVKSQSTVI